VGILIVLGVILFGGALILLISYLIRGRGSVTPMVRIAIAGTPIEMELWTQRLQGGGVPRRVQGIRAQVGDPSNRWLGNDYSIELWVRATDETAARELLGLGD
jgi:hypothetical protein